MDINTSRRIGKVQQAIHSLPEAPSKHIFWIVYNHDMVEYTENMIAEIRGEKYLLDYVTVVAKADPSHDRACGAVYFDPGLLDLLGNGNA